MRKINVIALALVLAIIMVIPMALPASADNPEDNQPVAWVSFGGSNASNKDEMGYHAQVSVLVKQYRDGSTVGYYREKNFSQDTSTDISFSNSHFTQSGDIKTADLLAKVADPKTGLSWWMWWKFTDASEPAAEGDSMMVYFWATMTIDPTKTPPKISFVPADSPQWPPIFTPAPGPGTHWFPFLPNGPLFFARSNVQIHITSEYK